MFKVGIIGVRPKQLAQLQKLDLRHIEISAYDAKKMTPESVANFCRDLDRIVLLQTGAPKTAYMGAPKDRLQVIRNSSSISSVVRALNTIETEQAFAQEQENSASKSEQFEHQGEDYSQSVLEGTTVEPVASEPTPTAEPEPVVERVLAKQAVQLLSEVPTGHVSQYALPKFEDEYVVSLPNSGGKQSYELLLAAVPGDIIRYARPEGLPLEKWQGRIKWARSYYWKNHGMLIEAHYFADFVDLKVMDKDMSAARVTVTDTLNLAPPVETTATEPVAEVKVVSNKISPRTELPPYRPRLGQLEVLREAKEKGLFTAPAVAASETNQDQPPSEDKGVIVTVIPNGMSAAEMTFDDIDEAEQTVVTEEATPDPVAPTPRAERLGGLAHSGAGPYFSGLDSTVFPEGVVPPEKNVIHPLRDPNLHTPTSAESTTEKQVSTELENKFWRKVFFHFLNKGMDAAKAADEADTALTRYRNTL